MRLFRPRDSPLLCVHYTSEIKQQTSYLFVLHEYSSCHERAAALDMFALRWIITNKAWKFTLFVHSRAERKSERMYWYNYLKVQRNLLVEAHLDCRLSNALSDALCCVSMSCGPLWQMHTDNTSQNVPSSESLPDSSRNFLYKLLLP